MSSDTEPEPFTDAELGDPVVSGFIAPRARATIDALRRERDEALSKLADAEETIQAIDKIARENSEMAQDAHADWEEVKHERDELRAELDSLRTNARHDEEAFQEEREEFRKQIEGLRAEVADLHQGIEIMNSQSPVQENKKLRAEVERLRRMLRALEWSSDGACPICRVLHYIPDDDHSPGCALAAALEAKP